MSEMNLFVNFYAYFSRILILICAGYFVYNLYFAWKNCKQHGSYICFIDLDSDSGMVRSEPKFFQRIFKGLRKESPSVFDEESGRIFYQKDILIGRHSSCHLHLPDTTVSREFAVVNRIGRKCYEIKKKGHGDLRVNDIPLKNSSLNDGDILQLGVRNYKLSIGEHCYNEMVGKKRILKILLSLLAYQIFIIVYMLIVADIPLNTVVLSYLPVMVLPWLYTICMKLLAIKDDLSVEWVAFFLSTTSISLAGEEMLTTSSHFCCAFIGFLVFSIVLYYLDRLGSVKMLNFKQIFAGCVLLLIIINIIFGDTKNGSMSWISVAGLSVQPSELCKVLFILIAAATFNVKWDARNKLEPQEKKEIILFLIIFIIYVSFLCFIKDIGTAAVFLVIFVVGLVLRNGNLFMTTCITSIALMAISCLLIFSDTVARRFSIWLKTPFSDPLGVGYQLSKSMASVFGGGLFGLGLTYGSLHSIYASDNDLVFVLISEEMGLLMLLLFIAIYILLAVFAYYGGFRKSYYMMSCSAIAVCSILTQVILNFGGSISAIPLTGITAPFLSSGGSSLVASYLMLAFIAEDMKKPVWALGKGREVL